MKDQMCEEPMRENPIQREVDRLRNEFCDRLPRQRNLDEICAEVGRARTKFPDNQKLLAALMEEVGELAAAMLQRKDPAAVRKEAIQVAAVAVRLIEEGDSDFAGTNWSALP